MKKSNYVLFILVVMGTLLFGIGMCICLLTEWQLEKTGVCFGIFIGCIGIVLGIGLLPLIIKIKQV